MNFPLRIRLCKPVILPCAIQGRRRILVSRRVGRTDMTQPGTLHSAAHAGCTSYARRRQSIAVRHAAMAKRGHANGCRRARGMHRSDYVPPARDSEDLVGDSRAETMR